MILTFAIGSIAGPFMLGVSMNQLGAQGFLIYFAVVMGSLMLFILYRIQVRQALPAEAQEDFVVVPRMPPVHPQLDPRIDPDYDATDPEEYKTGKIFLPKWRRWKTSELAPIQKPTSRNRSWFPGNTRFLS